MLWILLLVFLVTWLFSKIKNLRRYWVDRGVKQGDGSIFGDNLPTVLRKKSFANILQMAYNMFPNTRYSGFYNFFTPVLLVKDPDLIKQVTVKDFDHFVNHANFVPEGGDDSFNRNLFSLKDQRWRDMRANTSPAFTSSKMKHMFCLISENCDRFIRHFLQKKEDVIQVEMKSVFTKFTTDVIANIGFGIEVNTLEDPENEFYLMGREMTQFNTPVKILKFFGGLLAPKLYEIFKLSPFTASTMRFFENTVQKNIDARRQHNIVRPDMINILMEAQRHGLKHEDLPNKDTGFATVEESQTIKTSKTKIDIKDEDIIAQAIGFFFAGFDTVSSLMSFMSYELGVNPEIQERLIREVDEALEACNGKITYEALLGMKYMDQVASETLRKWPNVAVIDRVCTKPYIIQPKSPNEKPLHVEKDILIWVPVYCIHRDPQHYPDPECFDPERFNDENRENIKPYTYMPFGIGPRACLGTRLALMETKLLFFHILTHCNIVAIEKTPRPLKFCLKELAFTAEGGFWLGLKKRVK